MNPSLSPALSDHKTEPSHCSNHAGGTCRKCRGVYRPRRWRKSQSLPRPQLHSLLEGKRKNSLLPFSTGSISSYKSSVGLCLGAPGRNLNPKLSSLSAHEIHPKRPKKQALCVSLSPQYTVSVIL